MGTVVGSLVDALRTSARGDRGIALIDGSREDRFVSYAELWEAARALLGKLRRAGAERGTEVVFQIDDHFAFLCLFWACQMGGMVPIPVAIGRDEEQRLRLFGICRTLRRPFLVFENDTLRARLDQAAARLEEAATFRELSAKGATFSALALQPSDTEHVENLPASPHDVAYVQFSSGSTGAPKGVEVTHANLLTNTRDIAENIGVTAADVFLSWKPLTHDFGIIGFHLLPVVAGVTQCWIPTSVFVRNPTLWIDRVHRYRASVLGTPNSGCRRFLQLYRREEASQWDLSCVRSIMNGGEPVSAEICREFLRELAPRGLAETAMAPGYGLAEASLMVALTRPGNALETVVVDRRSLRVGEPILPVEASAREALEVASLGPLMRHTHVRITADDGRELPEGHVGHVHMRGENVTSGYYGAPEAERRRGDAWLDTGDLGFMRGGHLHITGRIKDIIIIGGINYYAHDIERGAEGHALLRGLQTAACGVPSPSGSEDVVLFVRYKGRLEDFVAVKQAAADHIGRSMGIFPVHILPVEELPKTTSGKLQRHHLQRAYLEGAFDKAIRYLERRALAERAPRRQAMIEQVAAEASRLVEAPIADPRRSLSDYGLDSARAVELARRLSALFDLELPASLAYDRPDVHAIADHILAQLGQAEGAPRAIETSRARDEREPIAVIGLGCRFPGGASDPRAFQRLLDRGGDAVSEVPPARWPTPAGAWWRPFPGGSGASYSRHGAFLDQIDEFDSGFFGIAPVEADALDPQQRLLLEVSHEALEHAGLAPGSLRDRRVGVFAGIADSGYGRLAAASAPSGHGLTGTMASMAAGRVAYVFGFRGPAMSVDTACSSSLVCVHLAVQSLRRGESDMALAGGVNLMVDGLGHVALSQIRALSQKGRCSTFDNAADGYVRGEGCGVVLLKRLSDAIADGDRVFAVIRGTATNHDGHSNGLTAPNGVAQEEVIRAALADAGLDPSAIDYVEAHGTGTPLGDPQEVGALDRVFGHARGERLLVGSVKTNIGHLESAAGIAGLIKVVLALGNERIPQNLHFHTPNAHVPWSRIAVRVASEPAPWPRGSRRRAAGVSSFGFSGTNAHAIVEEAPPLGADPRPGQPHHLLCISARSAPALRALAARYVDILSSGAAAPADVCHTAAVGRSPYAHRLAVTGASAADLAAGISSYLAGQASSTAFAGVAERGERRVAFLFPQQGALRVGAGRALYETHPVFRSSFDACDALFRERLGVSVVASIDGKDASEDALRDPLRVQLVVFSLSFALARLWRSWGIRPAASFGDGVGEIAAACDAGDLSLEDAATALSARAALAKELPAAAKPVPPRTRPPIERPARPAPPSPPPIPALGGRPPPVENEARSRYLERLIPEYTKRTRRSKEHAARFRLRIADSRSMIGFRSSIKELLYPIVGDEAEGAHVRDIDGNTYVDMTMGFGVHLLGHRAKPVMDAILAHQARGFALGLRTEHAVEVAEQILRMTGMDRVAFVNSGSEAVMTALRVARAATRRDGIVLFPTSYHGNADTVLAAPEVRDGIPSARPLAVGVPQGAIQDVAMLSFGSEDTLAFIRDNAHRLAAVLVEPVPTRRPDLNNPTYLRRLREVTRESGVLLVFDEMVTGFRCHPGGVQQLFGIEADLVTYGKIIGGGLPIGVVAGRPGVLDSIDGGVWRYGDASFPALESSTFFGGTFFQHPLAMTAARAVLAELAARGPELQERLARRAASFAAELNAWFRAEEVPIEVHAFSSFFRLVHRDNPDLFYYNLLKRGVYIWEWRCWFLSDAHTDADLALVRDAIKDSVNELREHGILPGRPSAPRSFAAETADAPRIEPPEETEGAPDERLVFGDDEAARIGDAIRRFYADGIRCFIEIGTQPSLLDVVRQHLPDATDALFLPSSPAGSTDGWEPILASAGRAYVHGVSLDLGAIGRPFACRKVDVPTYPFERSRRWIAAPAASAVSGHGATFASQTEELPALPPRGAPATGATLYAAHVPAAAAPGSATESDMLADIRALFARQAAVFSQQISALDHAMALVQGRAAAHTAHVEPAAQPAPPTQPAAGEPLPSLLEAKEVGRPAHAQQPTEPRVMPMPSLHRLAFTKLEAIGPDRAPHIFDGWQLDGPVDVGRIERAFQSIVARHDSLRTGFERRGDELVVVVHPHVAASPAVVDVPDNALDAALKACIAPFDLARPPLVRLTVFRTAERSVLLFDIHHILVDGHAVDVFVRELMAAYEGAPLPPAAQYGDYIAWLDARSREIEAMAAYWLERLGGELPALKLPTDFARPNARNHEGRTIIQSVTIPGLSELARKRRASTFMVVLAAYYAWLHLETGQDDLIVGAIKARRDAELHDNLIWMTLNTIALRVRLGSEMTFGELLSAVQTTCVEAYANGDYPFERLVERLGAARDPSRHPIYDTIIGYEKPRGRIAGIEGKRASRLDGEKAGCQCDIDLEVNQQNDDLEMLFTFATALFREETMDRLARSCTRVLEQAVAHPDRPLSALAPPKLGSS